MHQICHFLCCFRWFIYFIFPDHLNLFSFMSPLLLSLFSRIFFGLSFIVITCFQFFFMSLFFHYYFVFLILILIYNFVYHELFLSHIFSEFKFQFVWWFIFYFLWLLLRWSCHCLIMLLLLFDDHIALCYLMLIYTSNLYLTIFRQLCC